MVTQQQARGDEAAQLALVILDGHVPDLAPVHHLAHEVNEVGALAGEDVGLHEFLHQQLARRVVAKLVHARQRPLVHGHALALVGQHRGRNVAQGFVAAHALAQLGEGLQLPARTRAHGLDAVLDDAHVVIDVARVDTAELQSGARVRDDLLAQ